MTHFDKRFVLRDENCHDIKISNSLLILEVLNRGSLIRLVMALVLRLLMLTVIGLVMGSFLRLVLGSRRSPQNTYGKVSDQ